jgi:hypothetical protein
MDTDAQTASTAKAMSKLKFLQIVHKKLGSTNDHP